MDRDGSGSITRAELDCEEFRTIIRSIIAPGGGVAMGGAHYARAEMNMKQAINFCLRKADHNHDTTLSFAEFRSFTWCLQYEHLAKDSANLIFALFDLDQDGSLSESEFREVWRFFVGHKPTEVEFRKEWERLDLRRAGNVSRAEYARWLRTSANPIFKQHAPPEEPCDASEKPSPDGRLPRARTSGQGRPQWNTRLVVATPGVRTHLSLRTYFSRPQSLPDLARHYETRRGFAKQYQRLQHHQEPKKKVVLSTDKGYEFHPERALPGGTMRSRSSGKLEAWEDHWQTPLSCVTGRYRPGTMGLRASEPPPQWMLDYKADPEPPRQPQLYSAATAVPAAPATAPKVPGAGLLVLVGMSGQEAPWLADGLAEGPALAQRNLGRLRMGRPELKRKALVLEVPGPRAGLTGTSAAAAAARLAATLEACLLDPALGGVAGVLVTCEAGAGTEGPAAGVVRALVRRGFAGPERWRHVVLCGMILDPDDAGGLDTFERQVADAFFCSESGPRGGVVAVGLGDVEPLVEVVRQLPRATVSYTRPDAGDLADELVEYLGTARSDFIDELNWMREEAAGERTHM